MARAAAFVLVAVVACLATFHISQVDGLLKSSPANDWNDIVQQVIRKQGIPSQISSRYFALVHLSIYRVLAFSQYDTSYPGSNRVAGAHYAAHYVLSREFPVLQSPIFDNFLASKVDPLKLTSKQVAASKKLAKYYAVPLLKFRSNDGSQDFSDFHPAPVNGTPGAYQFTPGQTYALYPQLGETVPILLKEAAKTFDTNAGPFIVDSPAYIADLTEVQDIGLVNSPDRDAYDTETAFFWADPANTSQLAGHFFNIAKVVLPAGLSDFNVAKIFAQIAVAQYDASIATYYQKYKYLNWRPVTAIRQTTNQTSWTPLLATPPHPEYPSGHSATAASSAYIIARALGLSDPYNTLRPFQVTSEGGAYAPRTYTSLGAIVDEIGDSRVFGGIHFRHSVDDGATVGFSVAAAVYDDFNRIFYGGF